MNKESPTNIMKNANNNDKRKTSVICVVALIVVAIIVLFAISAVFKIHPHRHIFSAEWTADGYLGYIGALIGAIATIYAVRITIVNERKRQEEERIILAKPWLSSETLLLCSNKDILEEENGKTTFAALNGELFGSSKEVPWSVKKRNTRNKQNGLRHKIRDNECWRQYCNTVEAHLGWLSSISGLRSCKGSGEEDHICVATARRRKTEPVCIEI